MMERHWDFADRLPGSDLTSIIKDMQSRANASRRSQATPPDFEATLKRFNIPTGTLRPHVRNPIRTERLAPAYADPLTMLDEADRMAPRDLPLIGADLSGGPDKDAKPWIPASFPDFPSIHTFKATPVDLESVMNRGTGILFDGKPVEEMLAAAGGGPAGPAVASAGGPRAAAVNPATVRPSDGPRGDPVRLRAAAALESEQAAVALRQLMRASKVASLKEVRANAERNPLRKARFGVWEDAMRQLIDEKENKDGSGGGGGKGATGGGGIARREIADYAMMVNAEKKFARKPVQKMVKSAAAGAGAGAGGGTKS